MMWIGWLTFDLCLEKTETCKNGINNALRSETEQTVEGHDMRSQWASPTWRPQNQLILCLLGYLMKPCKALMHKLGGMDKNLGLFDSFDISQNLSPPNKHRRLPQGDFIWKQYVCFLQGNNVTVTKCCLNVIVLT